MEKIALVTDSACDLDENTIKKYNIFMLPFRISYKDREYKDKIDIDQDYLFDNIENEIPKSSLPSMEDIEKTYNSLEKQGYTHVIAVVISSGLSGTYNAFKIVSENHKNIGTYIYDSKTTSIGEGAIVAECGKLIESGKSFEDITKEIPQIKKKTHLFFVFGTLEYAKRGGRIGKIAGTIGEFLNIKPIVIFDDDGECLAYAKARGRRKSIEKMIDIGKSILENKKCDVYILSGASEKDAKLMYDTFSKLSNVNVMHYVDKISAVVGIYSGPGVVGMCFEEQ